eukprot:12416389-Karenia_brevis.AAC.1
MTHSFCSDACARAGKVISRTRCKSAAHITMMDGYYHCGACTGMSPPTRRQPKGRRVAIDTVLDDQMKQLVKASRRA